MIVEQHAFCLKISDPRSIGHFTSHSPSRTPHVETLRWLPGCGTGRCAALDAQLAAALSASQDGAGE